MVLLVNAIVKRFRNDFMANCSGSIHGNPSGTIKGLDAMKQSIDKTFGPKYNQAIQK